MRLYKADADFRTQGEKPIIYSTLVEARREVTTLQSGMIQHDRQYCSKLFVLDAVFSIFLKESSSPCGENAISVRGCQFL